MAEQGRDGGVSKSNDWCSYKVREIQRRREKARQRQRAQQCSHELRDSEDCQYPHRLARDQVESSVEAQLHGHPDLGLLGSKTVRQ